jgi:threonine 3-dehydrogenase
METILVTGANGEIGHGLIPELAKEKQKVIALDVSDLDEMLKPFVSEFVKASVLQKSILEDMFKKYHFSTVYHMAALLSTAAEKDPEKAQVVNSGGTATLLDVTNKSARAEKKEIKFIFPSTIAVYGLPSLEVKEKIGKITETDYLHPITMYGVTKLYCEMLGKYYTRNYKLLGGDGKIFVDFRSVRFPGIISALTIPTGGTSDYAPEMIHSAAKGDGYESFVSKGTKIPFMVMPDAVKALIQLNKAEKKYLSQLVYNVTSFAVTAEDIAKLINGVFSDSSISYKPDNNRQKIVDSWPEDLDDTAARKDWGWKPDFDVDKSFKVYLIPEIQNKYSK